MTTRVGVSRIHDTPTHHPMGGSGVSGVTHVGVYGESELEEILIPPPLENDQLTIQTMEQSDAEDWEDGDVDEDDEDDEEQRPVISPNKHNHRVIQASVNPYASGTSTTQQLLGGGIHSAYSSQVFSANPSNVSIKVRGLHSPSHSMSIPAPTTPDQASEGSANDIESDMSLLQQASPVTGHKVLSGRSQRGASPFQQDRANSLFTPERGHTGIYLPSSTERETSPSNLMAPSSTQQHQLGSGSFSANHRRGPSGLQIQTNSSILNRAESIPTENLTPKPAHRHQKSWMGPSSQDEPPTPGTGHHPQAPATAGETTNRHGGAMTTRVHVVRVVEKSSKPSQNYGRTPVKNRGHGNYKMPNNPWYKKSTPASVFDKTPAAVVEEETETVKAVPLGESPWHARLEMPVYRADGELDPSYLAKKTRHRQKIVLVSFMVYSSIFLLLEVPYILYIFASPPPIVPLPAALNDPDHPIPIQWKFSDNLYSLFIRLGVWFLMALSAVYARFRHLRDKKGYNSYLTSQPGIGSMLHLQQGGSHGGLGYKFFPTDAFLGGVVCFSSVALIGLETLRSEDFLKSDLLLRDGVLLGLTLIFTYMLGILRLSRFQGLLQSFLILAAYNGFHYLTPGRKSSYLMKSDAYLVLLIISLGIYHYQLEVYSKKDNENKKSMNFERRKADKLLRSMLPGPVYSTVLEGRNPYLSGIATIGFCNVELTYDESAKPSPAELMQRLHDTFKRIDGIVSVYKVRGVHKIETVSKTYLLCCGLLEEIEDHAATMFDVSLEIMHMIEGRNRRIPGMGQHSKIQSGLKIGIATGPVVGGIIGTQRRFFRVFGDTVNVSARMCTNCSTWQIQANKYAYDSLNEIQRSQYKFPPMRILEIKGKGSMEVYLVTRRDDWQPRFGKAVMNRGKEDEEAENATHKDLASSFVFHKILKATSLRTFPLLQFTSTFEHHDMELLKNEGPSNSTTQHIEYRYQIQQFNWWLPQTKWNIAWFFIWCLCCFGVVTYQLLKDNGTSFSALEVGNVNFIFLAGTMLFMLALHFVSSYALASNNYYKKHTQSYTGIYAFAIATWILFITYFWGLNDGPIAPHFAFILLNLYTSLYLHLQLRFTVPLMTYNLLGFLSIMIYNSNRFYDIIFCLGYLSVAAIFILFGTYKGENRIRSNFLLQYALDMEQGQMDNFLKNLLPQFVVNVLKKQSPNGNKNGVAMTARGSAVLDPTAQPGTNATGGGNDGGEYSARGSRNDSRHHRGHSRNPSFDVIQSPSKPPMHQRRRSVFDAELGGGLQGGGGGLASRFAMNFPNATVFESDIVGYTKLVSNWPAQRTLNMLNELFSMFDDVAQKCQVEKIETIGDAFMCIVFENEPDCVLNFALDVLAGLKSMNQRRAGETPIEIRSGVCTGPCYGGVVGSDVPRFHMFGVAHDGSVLLEQNGRPGTAMVSGPTYEQSLSRYQYEHRPDIQCEGMGWSVYQLMGRGGGREAVEKNIFQSDANAVTELVPTKKGWV